MTTFWREGYYRTNVYGTTSWVDGHWVDRDNWDRFGSSQYPDYCRACLNESRVGYYSSTARYINPNADCPVCGAPVFFYQNENGSRVYFDELGPPWPKHPCTDNKAHSSIRKRSPENIEPRARSNNEISSIEDWIRTQPELDYASLYGHKPWEATSVLKRIKGAAGVFVILQKLHYSLGKKVFFYRKTIPKCVKEGAVVMMHKSAISFVDHSSMEPMELQIRRIRSAAEFIEELTTFPQGTTE